MSAETIDGPLLPVPNSHIQVDVSAVGGDGVYDLVVPDGASRAWISADVDTRCTDDGTTPTAAFGFPISGGEKFFHPGDISNLKFHSGTINVNFYY